MTTKYEKLTTHDLRNQCRGRDIKYPRNATKTQLVEALQAADKDRGDPADFGDLPPKTEAPDDFAPPEPPKTASTPAVKIPPDPADPADLPPEPKRYKLTNDITHIQNGLPTLLRAGAILLATEYDLEAVKKSGGVIVPARVFEQSKLPRS